MGILKNKEFLNSLKLATVGVSVGFIMLFAWPTLQGIWPSWSERTFETLSLWGFKLYFLTLVAVATGLLSKGSDWFIWPRLAGALMALASFISLLNEASVVVITANVIYLLYNGVILRSRASSMQEPLSLRDKIAKVIFVAIGWGAGEIVVHVWKAEVTAPFWAQVWLTTSLLAIPVSVLREAFLNARAIEGNSWQYRTALFASASMYAVSHLVEGNYSPGAMWTNSATVTVLLLTVTYEKIVKNKKTGS